MSSNKAKQKKLHVGNIVLLTQSRVGVVRYSGIVQGRSTSAHDKFYGIEIRMTDGVMGNSDGSFNSISYFKCNTNEGVFVRRKDIVREFKSEVLEGFLVTIFAFAPSLSFLSLHFLPFCDSLPQTFYSHLPHRTYST